MNERLNPLRGTGPWPCNPNLLDNWYFGNPINQRGQTEYTAAGYTIDRWRNAKAILHMSFVDEGMVLTREDTDVWIAQVFEDNVYKEIAGKTVTFSVLTSTGLYSNTTLVPDDFTSWDETTQGDGGIVFENNWHLDIYRGTIRFWSLAGGGKTTIAAAKLEMGSVQTLAHKESDAWVLNEVPDYGEQLARCQRYQISCISDLDKTFAVLGFGIARDANISFFIPLPTTMIKKPAIAWKDLSINTGSTNWSVKNVTTLSADRIMNHGIAITTNRPENINAGDVVSLVAGSNSVQFFLDANL